MPHGLFTSHPSDTKLPSLATPSNFSFAPPISNPSIEEMEGELEMFFPQHIDIEAEPIRADAVGPTLQEALTSKKHSDDELRYAIYKEVKDFHGIKFAISSSKEVGKYTEAEICTLLFEWFEHIPGIDQCNKEEKLFHKLAETEKARPDLTVCRENMMLFGEVKNSDEYTTRDASRQCALYLVSLLYFMRVRMGIPLQSVFGFFVCGCRCKKLGGKYAVGLIKLSEPDNLGESIHSHIYEVAYPTDDMQGIRLLVTFLKKGMICTPPKMEFPGVRQTSLKTPALLMLPVKFWNDKGLIDNGTTDMVFFGAHSYIIGLLNEFQDETYLWNSFKESVEKCVPTSNVTQFYLKVQVKTSTLQTVPAETLQQVFQKLPKSYMELYCNIAPYGSSEIGVFFMKDCGRRVDVGSLDKITVEQLCKIFGEFRQDVVELCKHLLHGHALPHNIVVTHEKKLMLIGLDKGTRLKDATEQIIDESLDYTYLRYPNYLRKWRNALLYTQIQLLYSFLYLLNKVMENETENYNTRKLEELRDQARVVNTYLKTKNDDGPLLISSEKEVKFKCLQDAINTLEQLLDLTE